MRWNTTEVMVLGHPCRSSLSGRDDDPRKPRAEKNQVSRDSTLAKAKERRCLLSPLTQTPAKRLHFPKRNLSVLCSQNAMTKCMQEGNEISHSLSTQKCRSLVDPGMEKTPDVETGHTGLHGFCLLPCQRG